MLERHLPQFFLQPWAALPRALSLTLLGLVSLSLGLGTPRLARACTCPDGPSGYLSWPEDGTRDAAIDSPIVVALTDHNGDPSNIGVALRSEDGEQVALTEVQRTPPSWKGCGAAEMVFLRPSRALSVGATYSVWFRNAPNAQEYAGGSFAVGDQRFVPDQPLDADVDYLAVYTDPTCSSAGCSAIAEVRVKLAVAPTRLLWLVLTSHADNGAQNHWPFRPEPAADDVPLDLTQRSVALAADQCIDLRIYGVDGQVVLEKHSCRPERCATTEIIASSTCGGPPASSLAVNQAPHGSCDNPPLVRRDGTLQYPERDAAPSSAGAADDAGAGAQPDAAAAPSGHAMPFRAASAVPHANRGGCSTLPPARSAAQPLSIVLLLGCALLRRWQRRCASR